MKFMNRIRAAARALPILLLAILVPGIATAQVVTRLPVYLDNSSTIYDFGNGPLELRVLQGAAQLFTSQGSGVGSTSGSSTALTLTATPTTAPCVGCIISGTGITSGTTVAAFNGTTGITLSAAMTVAASTALAWGAACPSTSAGVALMLLQVGQPPAADLPLYTQARICGGAQYSVGAMVLPFAIGAH